MLPARAALSRGCRAHALWVAFHGYGTEHDRRLNQADAFEETCLAVRRARECGLGTGAHVFLTRPGLRDIDRLLSVLLGLRLDMFNITIAGVHSDAATCARRWLTPCAGWPNGALSPPVRPAPSSAELPPTRSTSPASSGGRRPSSVFTFRS